MSPIDRRRRRRRRGVSRSSTIAAAVGLAAALVLALVIGGALKIGAGSTAYWRDVDRSFAAQVRALTPESRGMRAELATFVPSMPGETRTKVEATLDTLVRSADRMATAAGAAATPPPAAGAGQDVAQAFADRARAVQMLRAAADGLLGMAPLPVLGAPDASPPVVSLSSSASS